MKAFTEKLEHLNIKKWFCRIVPVCMALMLLGAAGTFISLNGQQDNIRAAIESQRLERQRMKQEFNIMLQENANGPAVAGAVGSQGRDVPSDVRREMRQERMDRAEGMQKFRDDDWGKAILWTVLPPTTLALMGLTGAAGVVLVVSCWLLLAAWVYQAASKSGMNRTLWGLCGLVASPLAFVAFLLWRSRRMTCCEACGTWQKDDMFCKECGEALHATCADCGSAFERGSHFCPHCGNKMILSRSFDVNTQE